MEKNQHVAST